MATHLPGKFCGQRSLVGYSPWGRKESDKTECPQTHTLNLVFRQIYKSRQGFITESSFPFSMVIKCPLLEDVFKALIGGGTLSCLTSQSLSP